MSQVTSEESLAALVMQQPHVLGLSSLTYRSINDEGSITDSSSR